MENLLEGDRVKHPSMPDWGIGQVVEVISEKKVRVFFVKTGEKVIRTKAMSLTKVEGEEAFHPILENLRRGKHFRTLNELINIRSHDLPVFYFLW